MAGQPLWDVGAGRTRLSLLAILVTALAAQPHRAAPFFHLGLVLRPGVLILLAPLSRAFIIAGVASVAFLDVTRLFDIEPAGFRRIRFACGAVAHGRIVGIVGQSRGRGGENADRHCGKNNTICHGVCDQTRGLVASLPPIVGIC